MVLVMTALNPNGALGTTRSNEYLLTGQRGANYCHRGAPANAKARMLHMRKLKPKPTQRRGGKKQSELWESIRMRSNPEMNSLTQSPEQTPQRSQCRSRLRCTPGINLKDGVMISTELEKRVSFPKILSVLV